MSELEEMETGSSTLDALRTQITTRRHRAEARGVEHLGIRWVADSAGRQSVTEALAFADAVEAEHGPGAFTTQWKGANGQWAENVTRTDLLTVGMLIGQRRAACFARERELSLLAGADPESFDTTLIGTGWPD